MEKRKSSSILTEVAHCYLTRVEPVRPLTEELLESGSHLGLGPLFAHIYLKHTELISSDLKKQLLSIQLTSKYFTATQTSAINEIINLAKNNNIQITLLKGIHSANRYYDCPHIRLMSDIDIIVKKNDTEKITQLLLDSGYVQESSLPDIFYETHQHLKPFHHTKTDTWIEIHTSLFPYNSSPGNRPIFQAQSFLNNLIQFNSLSVPVSSIDPTINLHYTISHWVREFKISNSLIQLLDIILIINRENIDWTHFTNAIKTRDHASEVKLVLGILDVISIINIPTEVLQIISGKKDSMGYLGRWLLNRIISGFLYKENFMTHVIGKTNCSRIWAAYLRDTVSISNHLYAIYSIIHPQNEDKPSIKEGVFKRTGKLISRALKSLQA